jgi:hypothetical protein
MSGARTVGQVNSAIAQAKVSPSISTTRSTSTSPNSSSDRRNAGPIFETCVTASISFRLRALVAARRASRPSSGSAGLTVLLARRIGRAKGPTLPGRAVTTQVPWRLLEADLAVTCIARMALGWPGGLKRKALYCNNCYTAKKATAQADSFCVTDSSQCLKSRSHGKVGSYATRDRRARCADVRGGRGFR